MQNNIILNASFCFYLALVNRCLSVAEGSGIQEAESSSFGNGPNLNLSPCICFFRRTDYLKQIVSIRNLFISNLMSFGILVLDSAALELLHFIFNMISHQFQHLYGIPLSQHPVTFGVEMGLVLRRTSKR